MLRNQVLLKWGSLTDKLRKEQKGLKFLAINSLTQNPLPRFPLDSNTCRRNLDFWTSLDYQIKLDQHKSNFIGQINKLDLGEHLSSLSAVYLDKIDMFNNLVKGWKKDKDFGERFGPTIEEID